jgi:hypothetical protein
VAANAPLTPLTWLTPLLEVAVAEGFLKNDDRALVESWSANPQGWLA